MIRNASVLICMIIHSLAILFLAPILKVLYLGFKLVLFRWARTEVLFSARFGRFSFRVTDRNRSLLTFDVTPVSLVGLRVYFGGTWYNIQSRKMVNTESP